MEDNETQAQAKKQVAVLAASTNMTLAVLTILIGWIGHSQAVIADGLHTLSDLLSDILVLFVVRHSSAYADHDHPYGHARFETAASVAIGALLMIVGAGIMYDAARRLLSPELLMQPGALALGITVVAIISKELLYQYVIRVAERLQSDMLKASAWHHRSDSLSSVIVLIGVGGGMLGARWLDAVAAMGVALMIAHIGWKISWKGIDELVDKGLDAETLARIRSIIATVCGVRALHQLRSRRMGSRALVDVHLLVESRLSVSEGHHIGEMVRRRLMQTLEGITDVTVHIDPEDDESGSPSAQLPERDQVLAALQQFWQNIPLASQIDHITLHYLYGKIGVDVYLPLSALNQVQEAAPTAQRLAEAASQAPYIGKVAVYYR